VLIYITDSTNLDEVVQFLLEQPEVEYHEAGQQKRYAAGSTARSTPKRKSRLRTDEL
jgi:hypothetical protein